MRFTGIAYRAFEPKWACEPLSGAGAANFGGRFNKIGRRALYLSLAYETAVMEIIGAAGFVRPLTLCSYKLDVDNLFDATDGAERERLNVAAGDLDCAWELLAAPAAPAPSQILAERLIAQPFNGMMVQSFAPGASAANVNLVLWRWGDAGASITVVDPEDRLPKDQSSWSS